MRRREFITLLSGTVAALPLGARAQEPGRIYRLGSLGRNSRSAAFYSALFEGLKTRGFVEGQNLLADPKGYELRVEQLEEHASEVVKAKVDLIFCSGDAAIRAAQAATSTIPIFAVTDDMIGSGFVHSLAKPEGNTTGTSLLATELDGKRQEILLEAFPSIRQLAALAETTATSSRQLEQLKEAARMRGVVLLTYEVSKPEEIAGAIDSAKSSGADALNVMASPLLFANRHAIYERATKLALPAMHSWPEMAEEGGLIAYGPRLLPLFRDVVARQMAELLRGAKVADVPVEQPSKFELVINLKAARALGLAIPESFLVRADKVIE
jgi:putative ABC transport system substrate-binding protein